MGTQMEEHIKQVARAIDQAVVTIKSQTNILLTEACLTDAGLLPAGMMDCISEFAGRIKYEADRTALLIREDHMKTCPECNPELNQRKADTLSKEPKCPMGVPDDECCHDPDDDCMFKGFSQ